MIDSPVQVKADRNNGDVYEDIVAHKVVSWDQYEKDEAKEMRSLARKEERDRARKQFLDNNPRLKKISLRIEYERSEDTAYFLSTRVKTLLE